MFNFAVDRCVHAYLAHYQLNSTAECLQVAARLRLPTSALAQAALSDTQMKNVQQGSGRWLLMNRKLKRVEEVLTMLHLNKCADTLVGSAAARGISGA